MCLVVSVRPFVWAREDAFVGCKSHNMDAGGMQTDLWGATKVQLFEMQLGGLQGSALYCRSGAQHRFHKPTQDREHYLWH